MITAMKSVFYVMCLLVIITYVFAIAFTQLSVNTETIGDTYFSNVALSMYSLLIYATFLDDLSELMDGLRAENWPLLFLAFIFISLAALTVMNMLIGVLCEVVGAVADTERQEILARDVAERMHKIAVQLDTDFNDKISYSEFTKIIEKPEALHALQKVGVNPIGIVDFAELFFFEDGQPVELPFEKFMELVIDLRESNSATVKDVLNLWMKVKTSTNKDVLQVKHDVDALAQKLEDKTDAFKKRMDEKTEQIEAQLAAVLTEVRKVTSHVSH